MARHLTTLCAFGFSSIAGATPFVMPWPVAAFTAAVLLVLFFAMLEDRDALAAPAEPTRGGRR